MQFAMRTIQLGLVLRINFMVNILMFQRDVIRNYKN